MRILVVVLLAFPMCAQQTFQFTTQSAQFPSTIGFVSATVADLNGDGNPDLAMVDRGTDTIWIMLGDGTGKFVEAPGSRFHAGNGPNLVVAADFNSDGKMDLVVLNHFTEPLLFFRSSYSIFFGDGTGGFTPGPVQITSSITDSLVIGDFNNDGLADLALGGTDGISILLSDGTGNFKMVGSPFGSSVGTLVIGDFNNDGTTDLAALGPTQGPVNVYLGTGTATFTKSSTIAVPVSSDFPSGAVGDWTGDGSPDLAIFLHDRVLTFPGDGKGGFSGAITSPLSVNYIVKQSPAADFNGDGKLDLLVSTPNGALVLQGNGSGKFSEAQYVLEKGPGGFAITADANRDGKPDIIAADGEVSLNALKTIRIPASLEFHAFSGQRSLRPIAINSDLVPGLTAVADQPWVRFNSGQVSVEPSDLAPGTHNATVQFAAPGYFGTAVKVVLKIAAPSGTLTELSTLQLPGRPDYDLLPPLLADLNGDGKADLLVLSRSLLFLSSRLNDGAGNFTSRSSTPLLYGSLGLGVYATADFDGDGKIDAAVLTSRGIVLYSGDGAGGFRDGRRTNITQVTNAFSVTAADLDRDGNADLLIGSSGDKAIQVFLGDGKGGFREVYAPVSGNRIDYGGGYRFQVADYNGDGLPDLAFTNNIGRALYIATGQGDGHFRITQTVLLTAEDSEIALVSGDWNGDGVIDLAAVSSSVSLGKKRPNGFLSVLLGDGSGSFTQHIQPITSVQSSENLATADFDGDGNLDLAVQTDSGTTTILFGTGAGGFLPRNGYVLKDTYQALVADLNGDGRADVLKVGASDYGVLLGASSTALVRLTQEPDNPFNFRQTVAFDVSVSGSGPSFNRPEGAVSLFDGSALAGTAMLNSGTARFIVPFNPGRHDFRAVYSGNPRFTQATASLTSVETGIPTTLQSLGNAFPLRAKVSDANGNPVEGAGIIFKSGLVSSIAVTDASGIAIAASVTQNDTSADNTVTATVSGYPGLTVVFQLRN